MKKDEIFFGEKGLTSTSANHIANIAKENYAVVESNLEKAVFYTTEVSLLGTSTKNTLSEGVDTEFLKAIPDSLTMVARFKSLIAWLREALKAKERLVREAETLNDESIAEALGIELPKMPESYVRLTEDDVVASWNIKERNRYYFLDTLCSTIGKYIHPDRGFSNARESFIEKLSEKHSINGGGRDTVIYSYIPTVAKEDVEDTFFKLQNSYREFQAELNSMKHQIEVALQEDDREKSQKETEERDIYLAEMQSVVSKISSYRKEKVREAQSLKIVIPDSLKSVYETVSNIGK